VSQVDERLMAAGSFTVDLDPGAPESVKALVDKAFSRVVVTAVRVDSDAMSSASLLSLALYAGVFRRWSQRRCRIEGAGLPVLLGDEDGKGNLNTQISKVSARPLYDGTNTSWIYNNVLRVPGGGANGVTVGTIASNASPTKKGAIDQGDTQRDVLEFVCDVFTTSASNPYEWRVNPDGTLDVAKRNTLFPKTVTPTVIASPEQGAATFDSAARWLPVDRFELEADWEDYTTSYTVSYDAEEYDYGVTYAVGDTVKTNLWTSDYYECATAHTSSAFNQPPNATYWTAVDPDATATVSTDFVGLDGSDLVMERVDSLRNPSSASNASAVAARRLGRVDDLHRSLSIASPASDIRSLVAPGDSVYVYDPESGLHDLTVEVDGGAVSHPKVSRVAGVRWSISEGMGVYVHWWDGGSFQVTDLSEFVVFGSGSAQLDVGEPRRSIVSRRPRFTWRPS